MRIPQYVTVDEVKRVCAELKLSDWTQKKTPEVSLEEARVIMQAVNTSDMPIDIQDFMNGLQVELEHGMQFADANVTNNHPLLTGLIVLAHFKESLDYYKLLEVAELEGDLVKALAGGNLEKIQKYYGKLAQARIALNQAELNRLG